MNDPRETGDMARDGRSRRLQPRGLLTGILCLVAWAPLSAQEDSDTTEVLGSLTETLQLWADIDPGRAITPNWEIYGDVGFRTELSNDEWVRFIFRPNVRYTWIHGIRLLGGIGALYTNNKSQANRLEIRPWVGGRGSWPRGAWPLEHMVRVEYRADYNTETWEAKRSFRFRYRARVSHVFRDRGPTSWRALASFEVFGTPAGEQGQFQPASRFSLGLDRVYQPGRRIRVEMVAQRSDAAFGSGTVDELYLRVRWFLGAIIHPEEDEN
jgi:hypothetical protein